MRFNKRLEWIAGKLETIFALLFTDLKEGADGGKLLERVSFILWLWNV
jgi:hypothetical protein